MDPLNLSGTETDKEEEEDDHEILFPSRVRESEEIVISPMRAQEATDCDIVNMVKTLNGRFLPSHKTQPGYNGLTNSCVQKTWQETRP